MQATIMNKNQNNPYLILSGVDFQTGNSDTSKFNREVVRKSVYINVDKELKQTLEEFGIQVYTSQENGQDFIIAPFSGYASYYNLKDKTVSKKQFTNEMDNFSVKEANVSITKNKNEKGNGGFFYRVSAFQAFPDKVVKSTTDYFGDASEFTEVLEGEVNDTPTLSQGRPGIDF